MVDPRGFQQPFGNGPPPPGYPMMPRPGQGQQGQQGHGQGLPHGHGGFNHPSPQLQHQMPHHPGFMPQQPRPSFQGAGAAGPGGSPGRPGAGMPMPMPMPMHHQQPFHNHQQSSAPYPPSNNAGSNAGYSPNQAYNNNSNSHFNNNNGHFNNNNTQFTPGFAPQRPGQGQGQGYPGGGMGPRPPFMPPQPSFGPGAPPMAQSMSSPMMMPQSPHPPRHQDWPTVGRPPAPPPTFSPANPSQGYHAPPAVASPSFSHSPALSPSSAFPPRHGAPPVNQLGQPSFSGVGSAGMGGGNLSNHPPTSPGASSGLPSPTPTFKASAPMQTSNTSPSNPLANPMSAAPSSYKPKTSYQAPPAPSPKKEAAAPTGSPSWQNPSASTPPSSQSGYQASHSNHRPHLYPAESYDADDRPTELIPIEEDRSVQFSSQTPTLPLKGSGVSLLQSPSSTPKPTSAEVSPSPSFATISYLPASPILSDTATRSKELQDAPVFPPTFPAKSPIATTSLGGPTYPASSFVPSTSYISTKKDATKSNLAQPTTNTGGFDSAVKVEVSELRPNSLSASVRGDSIKVEVSDLPSSVQQKPQQLSALDSPISFDGLMESLEAMTMPSSSSSSSQPFSSTQPSPQPGQGGAADYFKPLPVISEDGLVQKRYSLSDGPSPQPPAVTRLVPKRPTSAYLPPPPPKSENFSLPRNDSYNPTVPENITHAPTQNTSVLQPFTPPPPPPAMGAQDDKPRPFTQYQPRTTHQPNHNHSHIGGETMQLFTRPEFMQTPITSMAAFSDRPVQKIPSMVRRGKTLKRAAGITGVAPPMDLNTSLNHTTQPVTRDDLYPYLLRLILLAQADEVALPPTPALPVTLAVHKDLVKALRARVKDILAGRDQTPAYQDTVVKKALANMEPKQFKASTNAEELMIGFSIEMSRIQQTMNIPTNNRDAQIAIMVGLIRDVIRQDPFVGSEAVLQRLDKQVKTTAAKPNNAVAQAEELTKVIKDIFKFPENVRQSRMNELRRSSSKQIAIDDLKKCLSNLELDCFPYPGPPDYHSKEHHDEFKNRERSALGGLIRVLSAGNPGAVSTDIPSRQFNPSELVFIPHDPKAYYHLLLNMCVDHALATRRENDPASTLIPPTIKAMLIDCGVRWRLTSSWREIILMEVVKERYRDGQVSVAFLLDFLHSKFYKDSDVNQWHISEVNMLSDVYGGLNHMIFDNINHDMKNLESVSADYFRPMLDILDFVHQQEVYQKMNIDLTPFFEDIKETILLQAIHTYNSKDEEVQKEGYENETVPLTKMALYIVSDHGIMKKRFPNPLFGSVDVAAIVVESNLKNFVPLMQNMANMDATKLPMADVFPLYQLCRELVALFEVYAPSSSAHFNISTWFRPYVLKYLETLDNSINGWVTAAIEQDRFEEVTVGAGHSSSASDLFAFFYEPLTWAKGLNWPDEYQRATFISKLAKVFCKAVDLYAQVMETKFIGLMPASVTAVTTTEAKTLTEQLTSFAFRSETAEAKKADQFVFTPEMCVLVNNIEAVRQRLDELYRNMDVDEIAQILQEHDTEPETDPNAPHQFEIVFVGAERLLPMDSNDASDPFVVLSNEGRDVFRTRTIYANINPRWNEVYNVTLTKEINYLIRIFDADKMHKDRLCGRQQFSIDPSDYEDYMPHDVWLDLVPIGRLLLRVTMKGERDDIQFYFGRTFRSLKRKEADLSGMIVDAMIPSMQACLTEKILFNNFRSKAVFSFFSSSVSSSKVTSVSDEDCDNALGALIDYLEASLPILYDYLTTEGMTMVITRLWKEILTTIESLLIPPLSTEVYGKTPLTELEMHVVFKIIEFIKLYLNGGDAGDGFPLKVLEIPKYRDLLNIRPIYDSSTSELIAEYNRSLTIPGRGRLVRQQSDFDRRSAGAVRRPGIDSMTPNPETILRILRTRDEEGVQTFLESAIDTQSKAREARAQAKRDQMAYQRQIMRANQQR